MNVANAASPRRRRQRQRMRQCDRWWDGRISNSRSAAPETCATSPPISSETERAASKHRIEDGVETSRCGLAGFNTCCAPIHNTTMMLVATGKMAIPVRKPAKTYRVACGLAKRARQRETGRCRAARW